MSDIKSNIKDLEINKTDEQIEELEVKLKTVQERKKHILEIIQARDQKFKDILNFVNKHDRKMTESNNAIFNLSPNSSQASFFSKDKDYLIFDTKIKNYENIKRDTECKNNLI